MTPLAAIIRDEIAKHGPMGMDRYMALCLMHPGHGYYTRRDPFGASGDFVTAPEVSQMFGELVGLWIAQVWQDMGRPDRAVLAELGPGRGTLMVDALRAMAVVPGLQAALQVVLVEQSPLLRDAQAERLAGANVSWVPGLDAVPEGPLVVVANEFFDALPIRQAERIDSLWLERVVRIDGAGAIVRGHRPLPQDMARSLPAAVADGTVIEWSEAGERIAASIGSRIARDGGAALIVDYGADGGTGDTLQAVRNHAPGPVTDHPGEADLSAHVDIARLARAAAPARAAPLADQGAVLARLGIGARAERLARTGNADAVAAALDRLTSADGMGSLFKVLGLAAPDAPPLPGLEDPC